MGAADPVSTNGPRAVRGVCLAGGASLSGFQVIDGHTITSGDGDRLGGGVFLEGDGTLSNCVVKGCSADFKGGGVSLSDGGDIVDCTVEGNTAVEGGGGVYAHGDTILERCIVRDNMAMSGGVQLEGGGHARNCLVTGNRAGETGGGIHTKDDGGRVALIQNCTVGGNEAKYGGGWFDFSTLPNDGATCDTCIVTFNTASVTGRNWHVLGGRPSFFYSCTTPTNGLDALFSESCIADDPQFIGGGNFRLESDSPAIDSGAPWITSGLDLDGNARVLAGATKDVVVVDMGCYEHVGEAADSDGDGMSDKKEEIAGTNPRDPDDYFHIVAVSNASVALVYFTSTSNRLYLLYWTSNLTNGLWWVVDGVSNAPGWGGTNALPDLDSTNAAAGKRFYRVGVKTL